MEANKERGPLARIMGRGLLARNLQNSATRMRLNWIRIISSSIVLLSMIILLISASFGRTIDRGSEQQDSSSFSPQVRSRLSFSTYFGGGSTDEINAIVVDKSANMFVAGSTRSKNFPIKNAFQNKKRGGLFDGFIAKLNASGSVIFSTYFGGTGSDEIRAAALDDQGNVYITGFTESVDFPTTPGAYQSKHFGRFAKVFVAKLRSDGSVLYSSYLGGDGSEAAYGIAVDKIGNAIVTGTTNSFDFPTKNRVRSYSGDLDAFVTKFNPTGSSLVYSTYLGGLDEDIANAIALDAFGNAYVTGSTRSSTFPRRRNLFPFHHGFKDAFITKLNPSGTIVYSVFFGGSDLDVAKAIAVTKAGNVYIGGYSTSKDLPTKNALQAVFGNGETKAFLTKVNSQGTGLIFSTYFGGDGLTGITSIQLDSSATAYLVGTASTTNMELVNPLQNGNRGGADAIVAKISASGTNLLFSSYFGGGNSELGNAGDVDNMGRFYVAGNTLSPSTFPLENPFQNRYGGGMEDGFITRIDNNP